MESNRERLIRKGAIIDPPRVKRFANRYRKDIQLSPEQVDSLKVNYGILANRMSEKEILPILRKKLKHYKFTQIMFNTLN